MNSDLLPFGSIVHIVGWKSGTTQCGKPQRAFGEDIVVDSLEYTETILDRDDLRCRECESIAF